MKRLNLCVDIDGTITDAYDWIPWVNKHFGTTLTPEQATVYEIHQVLGVSAAAYDEFYRIHGQQLHAAATLRKNARRVLTGLYQQHGIHFVTAREQEMESVTKTWFAKQRVPYHTLSLVGSVSKVRRAEELRCHLFMEDKYENAVQLADAGFQVLLIDCYYNRQPLPPGVERVDNWNQIESIVKQLAGQPSPHHQLSFPLGLAE